MASVDNEQDPRTPAPDTPAKAPGRSRARTASGTKKGADNAAVKESAGAETTAKRAPRKSRKSDTAATESGKSESPKPAAGKSSGKGKASAPKAKAQPATEDAAAKPKTRSSRKKDPQPVPENYSLAQPVARRVAEPQDTPMPERREQRGQQQETPSPMPEEHREGRRQQPGGRRAPQTSPEQKHRHSDDETGRKPERESKPRNERREPPKEEQSDERRQDDHRRPGRDERKQDNRRKPGRSERKQDDRRRPEREDRPRDERRPDDRRRDIPEEERFDDRRRPESDDRARDDRRRPEREDRPRDERRPDDRRRDIPEEERFDDRRRPKSDDRARDDRRRPEREDKQRDERRPDDRRRPEREDRPRDERRPDDRRRDIPEEERFDDRRRPDREDRPRDERRPDDRRRPEREDRPRDERRPDDRRRDIPEEERFDDRRRPEREDRPRDERRPDDRRRPGRDDRRREERRRDIPEEERFEERRRNIPEEERFDDHTRPERGRQGREEHEDYDIPHPEDAHGNAEDRSSQHRSDGPRSRRGRRGGRNRNRNRRQDTRLLPPDEVPPSEVLPPAGDIPPADIHPEEHGDHGPRDERRSGRNRRRDRRNRGKDRMRPEEAQHDIPADEPADGSHGPVERHTREDERRQHRHERDHRDERGRPPKEREGAERESAPGISGAEEEGHPAPDTRHGRKNDRRSGRGRDRRKDNRPERHGEQPEQAADDTPHDLPDIPDTQRRDADQGGKKDRPQKQQDKKQGRQKDGRHQKPAPAPVEVVTLKDLPAVSPVVRPARTKPVVLLTSLEKQPELREFYTRLEHALRYKLVVRDEEKIVVAVSGGVDSTVLLDALVQLSSERGYELVVAHFNHRLRQEASDRDEQFVRELAKKYRLPFFSGEGNVMEYAADNRMSIEVAARELRYRYFEYVMRQTGSSTLALAHTADDVAETVLLNLLRGSGLTGLTGMPARRSLGRKTFIIRPLLSFKKDELKRYAALREVEWQEDETNSLLRHTRNKVRHHLLPLLRQEYAPSISDTLNRTARLLQGADELVSQVVSNVMPQVVTESTSTKILLSAPALASHTVFLQGEIIQRAIRENFDMPAISMDAVERILKLLAAESGTRQDISRHICAVRDREAIVIALRTEQNDVEIKVGKNGEYTIGDRIFSIRELHKRDAKFNDDPSVEFIDAELLPYQLTLRTWKQGDTFQPLGMRGTMKVSDFLTNQKVPVMDKNSVLVLCTAEEIVWVCGMRINDKYKVTRSTEKVVRLEFIKRPKP